MKLISRVYDEYQIMPNLQMHQYRVAAVASLIVEHFDQILERNEIISACLLHDMGNIIKFDLQKFPDFLRPQGLEYWEKVKASFTMKFGDNEHTAAQAIAKQIGVSSRTLALIESISQVKMLENPDQNDLAARICEYCDLRVTPWGITSLDERWQDLRSRYGARYDSAEKLKRVDRLQQASKKIENDIFAQCAIKPDQITEASAVETITQLHNFILT